MNSVLVSVISFIVAIGVLITVHEFGHFWVARRLGVKVLKFSVGFGRPLWSRRGKVDGTEYVIAAIPLGGYVKMLDEHEGDVTPEERARAFNRQALWKRSAIVVAGPVANFLFAIVAYWLVFVSGVEGTRPVIGEVEPASIAATSGFLAEDEIVAVAGQATPTWDATTLALLDAAIEGGGTDVEVRRSGSLRLVRLELGSGTEVLEGKFILEAIGLSPWRPRIAPVIDRVLDGGAADAGGLRGGDRVLSADGEPMEDWGQWVEYVRARPGQRLSITVDRDGARLALTLEPERIEENGQPIGRIGAYPRVPPDLLEGMRAEVRYGPLEALGRSLAKTYRMSVLMLKMLGKMLVGQASIENISGPISIAQYAGQSASIGVVPFVLFLAVISISLGIINILPIPLLDGGHLLYYAVELIKGSPLSEAAQILGQKMGIVLLLLLMGLAFYNDLARLIG